MDSLLTVFIAVGYNYFWIVCFGICFVVIWTLFFTKEIQWQFGYFLISFCCVFLICWIYSYIYVHTLLQGLPFTASMFTVTNAEEFLNNLILICLFFSVSFVVPNFISQLYISYICSCTQLQKKFLDFLIGIGIYYLFLAFVIVYLELYASSWQSLLGFLSGLKTPFGTTNAFSVNYDPNLKYVFTSFVREYFDFVFLLLFAMLLYVFFLKGYLKYLWQNLHGTLLIVLILSFYYFFGSGDFSLDLILILGVTLYIECFIFFLYFLNKLKSTKYSK